MDDDYLEAVLDLVAQIPSGRVMTYGTIADVLAERMQAQGHPRRGGPRQVGQVMSRAGGGVPWWRVVDAAGRPPQHHRTRALTDAARRGHAVVGRRRAGRAATGHLVPRRDGLSRTGLRVRGSLGARTVTPGGRGPGPGRRPRPNAARPAPRQPHRVASTAPPRRRRAAGPWPAPGPARGRRPGRRCRA